jgi:hypothetical protein
MQQDPEAAEEEGPQKVNPNFKSNLEQRVAWLVDNKHHVLGRFSPKSIIKGMKKAGLLAKSTYWVDAVSGIEEAAKVARIQLWLSSEMKVTVPDFTDYDTLRAQHLLRHVDDLKSQREWRTVIVGLPIIRKLLNGEEVTLEDFRINLIPDDVLFNAKPRKENP